MGNQPVTGTDADFLLIQTQTGWGKVLINFAAFCQPQAGWRVLDVGCGPGLLPALFAQHGCHAWGVDIDTQMLAQPRLHPLLTQADAMHLPFAGQFFDLVTASNLLFLLPDSLSALREMARVTRPGGLLAAINPSEHMSLTAATNLAEQRNLSGLARQSLLNYASRAENHPRWTEQQMHDQLRAANVNLLKTSLVMGNGLARFSSGVKMR
jgi:ubiquinone/menaquinone biosynthesis C-methylase UbiE